MGFVGGVGVGAWAVVEVGAEAGTWVKKSRAEKYGAGVVAGAGKGWG